MGLFEQWLRSLGYAADAHYFEVRLRFTGLTAWVVAEQQLHPSQSITLLKKLAMIEFCAELACLQEITHWGLSHRRHDQPLEPPELKMRVKEELRHMLEVLG